MLPSFQKQPRISFLSICAIESVDSNAVRAKETWNRMKYSFLHEICITGKIEEVKQALDAHPDLVYASDDYVRYHQVNWC